jgi:DNA-binding response OmpR family regulator
MNKAKIILIEDEVFINDLYKLTLEKAGYSVICGFDGEEGLQLIKDNTDASLILLDIMMPKKHGIDVLNEIKANPLTKEMNVVLLSNLGEENIIKTALNNGARDYLKKVLISPDQLVSCVEHYLSDPQYRYQYGA